ncbi:63 kDa sperm flagellar membrane protein-like [Saccoglossus kowalevskii]|uniref:63 kDa sperm flagellar membrane protein-like n=1 Tax=Saccoglossus kowalevskii TaxID=10224 RepID=A0ABM0GWZ4_SACKO|nr:PREDICTED: 63 kDa sperm flagellar membrane protein-like [Saccoglossus kowalevskii]
MRLQVFSLALVLSISVSLQGSIASTATAGPIISNNTTPVPLETTGGTDGPMPTSGPAWCFTCDEETDNDECNYAADGTNNMEYCESQGDICVTTMKFNERGNGYRIEHKGCLNHGECYDMLWEEMFDPELMSCHGGEIVTPGLTCNYCCSIFQMPACNEDFIWYLQVPEVNEWNDALDLPGAATTPTAHSVAVMLMTVLASALYF